MWTDKISTFGNLHCSDCDNYYHGYESKASYTEPPYWDECPKCQRKEHLKWLITKKLRRLTSKEIIVKNFEDMERKINSIMGGRTDVL